MEKIFLAKLDSKITSEMFIKHIAKNFLNIQDQNLIIIKDKYGKPFMVDYPNIHYNISHTKGVIVCYISDSCVGIDIERIRNFNHRIPYKFFTKREQNYIFCKDEDQNKRFFEVWTRKEAYVKWIGEGIEISLNSFDVISDKRIITKSIDNYVISYCTKKENKVSASGVNNIKWVEFPNTYKSITKIEKYNLIVE